MARDAEKLEPRRYNARRMALEGQRMRTWRMGVGSFVFFACFGWCWALAANAQEAPKEPPKEDYVKAHYTKYEYRIPMRDGKRLFTSVYVPKDDSEKYPILMDRTPYSVGPYGEDQYKKTLGPSDESEKAGYIFVYQDV